MAESISLARPYARAAFEAALAEEALNEWSDQLALVSAMVGDGDLQDTLNHPGLTTAQKAQLIIDVCEGKLASHVENFLTVLAENHRLILLPEVAAMFEQLKSEREATVDVAVETAKKLTAQQEKRLTQSLEKKLERKVNLQSAVNEELIGGLVIHAGDLVIDASIRGRLTKLAEMVELR